AGAGLGEGPSRDHRQQWQAGAGRARSARRPRRVNAEPRRRCGTCPRPAERGEGARLDPQSRSGEGRHELPLTPTLSPLRGAREHTEHAAKDEEDHMEASIDTAALDAPASYALERSAPADTPAHLSTHDAAAELRKLRQPKTNDPDTTDPRSEAGTGSARATPAAPESGKESTAGTDPADDAAHADRQDPGERTEGADPADLPSIEPPRSWTKEDKELFASLPRATQERLAERERLREGDFLRRQNEAAEKLKGLTAKEQVVEQARQTYEAALPQLLQTLQQQQAGEFADIKSMADVERLAREDWPRYLLWDLQQKKIADVTQQLIAGQHRQAQEKLTQFAEFAQRQDDLFKEKVPDMADEAKAAELQKQALAVLGDLGFTEAELVPLWNGPNEPS